MARFAAALAFFHPGLEVLTFPAWDCLPYDRVSPNGEIISRRIDTLTRLARRRGDAAARRADDGQRAGAARAAAQAVRRPRAGAAPGGRIALDRLQSFFRNNGYFRTDTVREPGEFAVRGGIVDLYPAGAAQPMRLDFFGDTLESIRSFDPLTQRSTGALDEAVLRPVSEVLLDDAAIQPLPLALPRAVRRRRRPTTRSTNRSAPGGAMPAWSIGCRSITRQLETLFDYLPGAGVSFDHQAEEVRAHRLEAIADFYAARHN